MADHGTSSVSGKANLPAGDSQELSFRPGIPGRVTVHTDLSRSNAHTETGLISLIILRRPGATKPLATVKINLGSPSGGLSYDATAADLAAPGDWVCEVSNESNDPITFTTVVGFPIDVPLLTASIDIDFLNIILAKLIDAAAIRIHLESSGDDSPRCLVTLSPDIAELLKLPFVNAFHVADQSKTEFGVEFIYRILNLDSDPDFPVLFLQPDPLAIVIVVRFDTQAAKLVAQNLPAPDINLELFDIEADVGFDGSFQPTCRAIAHLAFNNIDFSNDVVRGVQDAIRKKLQEDATLAALVDKTQVRAMIDSLFARMMRLGKGAVIRGYHVDGRTLTVTYFVPPA